MYLDSGRMVNSIQILKIIIFFTLQSDARRFYDDALERKDDAIENSLEGADESRKCYF